MFELKEAMTARMSRQRSRVRVSSAPPYSSVGCGWFSFLLRCTSVAHFIALTRNIHHLVPDAQSGKTAVGFKWCLSATALELPSALAIMSPSAFIRTAGHWYNAIRKGRHKPLPVFRCARRPREAGGKQEQEKKRSSANHLGG